MLLWKRFTDLEVVRRLTRKGRQRIIPVCGNAKVGATAGWVITGATDICHATLPASQTGADLIIPLDGLYIGDTIRGLYVGGQVESAGQNASLAISIRKVQSVAAAVADTEVAAVATGNYTADAVLGPPTTAIVCNEPVVEGFSYYCLIAGTTGTSTDFDVTHLVLTVDEA